MNRKLLSIGIFLALTLFPQVVQSQTQQVVTADIPFEFVVNETVMPAGHYLISIDQMRQIMTFSRDGLETYQLFHRQDASDSSRSMSELRFVKTGDVRILHQVLVPYDGHIHDLIHDQDVLEPEPYTK